MRKKPEDMKIGSRFNSSRCGVMTVKEYFSTKNVVVMFESTGSFVKTSAHHIRNGAVNDPYMRDVYGIGFIGSGDYNSVANKDAYTRWRNMFLRCYSDKYQSKQPTYAGCEVCEEWHNFQSFAKWYYENIPDHEKKYDLDKDIKIDGNRVYSPDACSFVSRAENTAKSNASTYRFISPNGDSISITHIKKFCADNGLTYGSMLRVAKGARLSHKGWKRA